MKIYRLDVVIIPTNRPCVRDDHEDVIYKSEPGEVGRHRRRDQRHQRRGRPVLVGTTSIEKSEALSATLTKRHGIEHEVLNAKQHAREALIVAKAGQQYQARDGRMRGNVTIATNMAGRGTDIKLGPGVAEIGGLHVLGTERHEARRIDNQLRGRSGRQGDAGSSQFFLCFEDDLMRVFAPDGPSRPSPGSAGRKASPSTISGSAKASPRPRRKSRSATSRSARACSTTTR